MPLHLVGPARRAGLDVRLENESVWLTQSQMGQLFGCTTRNVRMHLENIYSCGELVQEATRKDFFLVRLEGAHRRLAEGYRWQVLWLHKDGFS